MYKFLENSHVVHAFDKAIVAANEDILNGSPESDVISMANAESAVMLLVKNTGATGAATIEVFACDDVTPTTTVAVSFHVKEIVAPDTHGAVTESKAFATTVQEDSIIQVEVQAAKIAEQGYKYVQFKCGEKANDPIDGAMVVFLMGVRYKEDQLSTQMA